MPILDDILAQPAILISMGVALLLIVAAIVLAVLPRIKASRVRAKRRKATRVAARNAAAVEAQSEAEAEDEAIEKLVAARKSAAAQPAKAVTPSAPVVSAKPPVPVAPSAPVVSAGSPAAAAASALNAALSGGTPEAKKEEVTPEMQDLLSSVFSDEDNSERQAILLKGNEPVAIDELLTLSKAVAAQLRGEQPSNIVRVKENQLT